MNINKDGEHSVRLQPFKDDAEGRIMVSTYDINDKAVAAYYPMTVEQSLYAAKCVLNGRPVPEPDKIDNYMLSEKLWSEYDVTTATKCPIYNSPLSGE